PFAAADPARPAVRTVVAMFLVDPHVTVLSSANVPPQQRHWWAEEVRTRVMADAAEEAAVAAGGGGGGGHDSLGGVREDAGAAAPKVSPLARLPQEVFDRVVESPEEFAMSMDEAKELRLELMNERSQQNESAFNHAEHHGRLRDSVFLPV